MSDLPDRLRAHAFNGMQQYELFSPIRNALEEAADRIEELKRERDAWKTQAKYWRDKWEKHQGSIMHTGVENE